MAYQNKRGIPLAHGMYLRHGQVHSGPTIATASTKAKPAVARDECGAVIAPRGENIALRGAPKNSGAALARPGMRSRIAPLDPSARLPSEIKGG